MSGTKSAASGKGGAKGGGKGGGGPKDAGRRGGIAVPAKEPRAKKGDAASTAEAAQASPKEPARLQVDYAERVRPALIKEFGYKSVMQVPRLEKIVINMGVGEAAGDQKKLDAAVSELMLISGQKPVKTVAKKAIAGFKIRAGLPIGCKVTLRRARMYEFLDRLVTIALPRVRDFRGITGKGFDGRGNFAMGLKEQIVFPEINYDKVDAIRGMDISS